MTDLHPLVVHFPIVLVILWPILDGLGLWLGRPEVSKVALGLLAAASVSALVASVTGQSSFDDAVSAGVDGRLLATHADDANLLPWAIFLALFVRTVGVLKFGRKGHVAAVVLGFALWPLVYVVGHSGGQLVFEHGVGVQGRGAAPGRVDAGPSPR